MTPLKTFLISAQALASRPVYFWPPDEQARLHEDILSAVLKLKITLEKKNLIKTTAYTTLVALESSLANDPLKEVAFIQNLANLVDVYRHAPENKKILEELNQLGQAVTVAKQRILEYHIALENLEEQGKKLSNAEKQKSDQKVIKEIGVFYILEYTIQVLYEFGRLGEVDRRKLLEEGINTKVGNLPAYLPLEDTFRKELCLKLFDSTVRDTLLRAFYNFEAVLYHGNIKKIGLALQNFNIALLKAFRDKGMVRFKAMIYKPFGESLPVEELIKKIETLKL